MLVIRNGTPGAQFEASTVLDLDTTVPVISPDAQGLSLVLKTSS